MILENKKILLGVTGSIAAYKSVFLVRLLVKSGAEVKVIMTKSATDFVSPLTFSTLSKNPVAIDLFEKNVWQNHVELARWADLFIIAPASANTIAKMANGLCDNMLLATYLSAACDVWIAPAMDEEMWHHPATQNNLDLLAKHGHKLIPVESGELASGIIGDGRMAEPESIVEMIKEFFTQHHSLQQKRVLITAGPTYENIDPVRFIGNHSSGKMGIAIAEEMSSRGADVILVLGPSDETVNPSIHTLRVTSAKEMYEKVMYHFDSSDYIIMAAAVADYRPKIQEVKKIKKKDEHLTIELVKTPDILLECGKRKKGNQTLVGFALETNNEVAFAKKKLTEKNADFIVLNSLNEAGAGFGHTTNKITIFGKDESEISYPLKSKKDVAKDIVNRITKI